MIELEVQALEGAGGDILHAWHWPSSPEGQGRAVVLVHEVFGLDAFVRGVGEHLAGQGYRVLAPDLYSREGVPGPAGSEADPAPDWDEETLRGAALGLPDRRAVADLEVAGRWLLERGADPEGLLVLGFGRGGTLAFLAGCQSRLFQAVVTFYGGVSYQELGPLQPVQPFEMALNLEAPLIAHFASQDPALAEVDVDLLRAKLDAFAKTFDFYGYEGAAHGFANPLRGTYHKDHAGTAWRRTFQFLDEVL